MLLWKRSKESIIMHNMVRRSFLRDILRVEHLFCFIEIRTAI